MNTKIISRSAQIEIHLKRIIVQDPSLSDYKIISKPRQYFHHIHLNRIENIIAHRKELWTSGTINDIELGHYFVYFDKYFGLDVLRQGIRDPRIFDWLDTEVKIGWCRGLKIPVYIQANGKHILFADNHNLALPFILEMIDLGIIPMSASLAHIDDHNDLFTNRSFDLKAYKKLETLQRVKYVYQNSEVDDWQSLLFNSGHLNVEAWRHFKGFRSIAMVDNLSTSYIERFDISDIDLDVLANTIFHVSQQERPQVIEHMIQQILDIASLSKVIIIVTSPGFIPQAEALYCGKKILKGLI